MGLAGGILRKNIRTTSTPAGTKFSTIPVQAIRLGDRKLAFQLVILKFPFTIFLFQINLSVASKWRECLSFG